MASRRRRFSGGYDPYGFFGGYDPYDGYETYYTAAPYETYYTTSPYEAYYQQQPAPTRSSAPTKPAPRPARETKAAFSIPVHGPDSEPERETKAARKAGSRADDVGVVQVMSAEEAAVRMQAAARGFLTRKSVRAVHEVQQEAEQVQMCEVETLVTDPRARAAVAEQLMRMLLRLDAVRGAREYRRKITKWVLALQDAIDTLETKPPAPSTAVPPELLDAAEHGTEMENIIEAEVDEAIAGGEPDEVEVGEEQEKEAVPGDANVDLDELADSDAEGEWEMVTEENEHAAPVAAMSDDQEPPPCNELPADPLETSSTTSAGGAASDGVDVRKVMEMVVALCEQSAKQGAVIGALAERVDMLERTLRRMEEAESCRRRSKKLSAEGEWKEQQQVLQRLMTHSR
ncbi:hypothetical protein SORBI_3005G190700 [Sorghum bicolor]|uniref:BAG domain-containing protein n=1 Tax=Sorghum bicolor TaxID=4558 RepID=A0A1Z5RJF3_SORBI|nr:hypothetical protein SORBI_3005G190700 [Sorghum bicolor]